MDPHVDDDPLAARIFKDFRNILSKSLDEYAIIPAEKQLLNKCPLVLIDGKLGIESWCLPPLLKHVADKMFRLKHETSHELNDVTRILLMLNSEFATAWNIRRRLSIQHKTEIPDELKFSELLLKRKAKSADNFSYRQFLLKQIQSMSSVSQQVIDNELRVCLNAASSYRRNYYAWSHRIWIMENLVTMSVSLIHQELKTIRDWIHCHVSEFSAFHYRQILLLKLKLLSSSFYESLVKELAMLDELFETFMDRESLFLHRRFLVILSSEAGTDTATNEKKFIDCQKALAGTNDWHLFLIQRHEKWLQFFFRNQCLEAPLL